MKLLLTIALITGLFSFQTKTKLKIKGSETIVVKTEATKTNHIKIFNSSGHPIAVKVINPSSGEKIRSFNLNALGKATVKVEPNYKLYIRNESKKNIAINVESLLKKSKTPEAQNPVTFIKFTLHNSTNKSIALIIPGVMNPNLSPNSDSGVSLKIGQKVFYKKNGRSKLLFEVSDDIKSGDTLDVAALIADMEASNK
ncbi:MAG: hypothetical protein AB8B72_04115 [Crocinitomicaceae bacterium]